MNFLILFTLLFLFARSIDLILQLDKFINAARATSEGGAVRTLLVFIRVTVDFQLPWIFQFYAFLHGLIAVGAMAFTLAQMHKHRELTALLASGLSLYRVAMPFFVGVVLLSVIGLLNQELMLPRVAPLLLRGHGQIGMPSAREFEVPITSDSQGRLLHAASFDPAAATLSSLTALERDGRGLTTRRITAERAVWDAQAEAWELESGESLVVERDPQLGIPEAAPEAIEFFKTDLDPHVLTMRRHGEYAGMLSLRQIEELLESNVTESRSLLRYRYARFATVLVNVLVLALTLPCFLLREPANLLRQSILCAGLAIPAMLGAAVGMMADLPGIAPLASVFLPVIMLLFIALVPWTFFKT